MRVMPQISVGGVSKGALLRRLVAAQVQLNPLAEQLFNHERFATTPRAVTVSVVVTHVEELGFAAGATFAQLVHAAERRGLVACPLELGPHLRLLWTDQPEVPSSVKTSQGGAPPGSVTVASAAPPDHEDAPWGFYLRQLDGASWLRGYRCWSGHLWAPRDEIAFVRGDLEVEVV